MRMKMKFRDIYNELPVKLQKELDSILVENYIIFLDAVQAIPIATITAEDIAQKFDDSLAELMKKLDAKMGELNAKS